MAKLFKNKLLKEKLNTFDVPDLKEKIDVLAKWANALQDNSPKSITIQRRPKTPPENH